MIEMALVPVFFCMTAGALVSITCVVCIVERMAGNTLFGRVLVAIVRMTAQAEQFFMLALKRKVGFVVIKTDFFPGGFIVTAVTFLTQLAIMWVVGFMTAVTAGCCFTKFLLRLVA